MMRPLAQGQRLDTRVERLGEEFVDRRRAAIEEKRARDRLHGVGDCFLAAAALQRVRVALCRDERSQACGFADLADQLVGDRIAEDLGEEMLVLLREAAVQESAHGQSDDFVAEMLELFIRLNDDLVAGPQVTGIVRERLRK